MVRQDDAVPSPTLLQAAVEELYSGSMAEFTARRKVLAAEARKAGDRETAAEITGLRKPTLSADTLNRLVRAAPDEVGELLELGTELRAAEKALDGAALRELSTQRRQLVGELTRLAFEITDQSAPSASVRDEVMATLNAALADEQVADRLLSGALVTQARWDGFGSTSLPELATVLLLRPSRTPSPPAGSDGEQPSRSGQQPEPDAGATRATGKPSGGSKAARGPRSSGPTAATESRDEAQQREAAEREAAGREAAEREKAERAAARLEAVKREAAEADEAATAAQEALSSIDRQISELSLQLAHARRSLAAAQRAAHAAENRRRAAQLALTRAGGATD